MIQINNPTVEKDIAGLMAMGFGHSEEEVILNLIRLGKKQTGMTTPTMGEKALGCMKGRIIFNDDDNELLEPASEAWEGYNN
jgi:hypothetical protein